MFRDRIIEAKKALGYSAKTMSERSTLKTPEETISRFLTGKINDPHISTLLDTGATVGLAPYEIFMDAGTAAEFRLYLETRETNIDNSAQLELLKIKVAELENSIKEKDREIHDLTKDLAHKDEIIDLYKKLLEK